jgi:hypothetical protein
MSSARALQSHKCGDTEVRVILYFFSASPGCELLNQSCSGRPSSGNSQTKAVAELCKLRTWDAGLGVPHSIFDEGESPAARKSSHLHHRRASFGRNIGGSFLRRESRNACKVVNWGLIPDGFISAIFWQQSGGIVCSKTYHLEITGTFRRQDGGSMVNKCCLRYLGLASSRLKVLGGWIST